MKIAILFAFTFLLNPFVVAQDIIVTKKADTIRCKINKIMYDKVQLSFENEKGNFVYSEINKGDLAFCYFNYNSVTMSGSKYVDFEREKGVFFIGLMIGTSIRIGEIANRVDPSLENTSKRGLLTSIQLGYYNDKKSGIGFTYSNRHTSSSYSTSVGSANEKVNIRYFAPTFFFKHIAKKRFVLQSSYSFGLINYSNLVEYTVAADYEYFGTSVGIGGNLHVGSQVTRTISISAVFGALLSQVNIDLKNDYQTVIGPREEVITSFDLGISMVFLFK